MKRSRASDIVQKRVDLAHRRRQTFLPIAADNNVTFPPPAQRFLARSEKRMPLVRSAEKPLSVIHPWHIHVQQQVKVVLARRSHLPQPIRTWPNEFLVPDRRRDQICVAEQNSIGLPRQRIFASKLSPRDEGKIFRIAAPAFQVQQRPRILRCVSSRASVDFPVDSGPKTQTRFT